MDLQQKAMSKLVGLQFRFQYKKGAENSVVDALSRVGHLLSAISMSTCLPSWLQEVANSYETDLEAQELLTNRVVHSPDENGYDLHQGVIHCKGRLFIGSNAALQTKLIWALHDSVVGGHSCWRYAQEAIINWLLL
jgi:hypothetical protein